MIDTVSHNLSGVPFLRGEHVKWTMSKSSCQNVFRMITVTFKVSLFKHSYAYPIRAQQLQNAANIEFIKKEVEAIQHSTDIICRLISQYGVSIGSECCFAAYLCFTNDLCNFLWATYFFNSYTLLLGKKRKWIYRRWFWYDHKSSWENVQSHLRRRTTSTWDKVPDRILHWWYE